MNNNFLDIVTVLGTIAFSVSGVFAAMQRKLDVFGIFIIAFITSVGGGTLRDILIGDLPVSWMKNITPNLVIIISAAATILFTNTISNLQKILLIFDSFGLGLFTIIGLQKGIAYELHPGICVALGTITGCFGGVIRDICLNNIPLIFHKEIYATACIIGGSIYFLLLQTRLNGDWIMIIGILVVVLIRLAAVRYDLSLPDLYKKQKN